MNIQFNTTQEYEDTYTLLDSINTPNEKIEQMKEQLKVSFAYHFEDEFYIFFGNIKRHQFLTLDIIKQEIADYLNITVNQIESKARHRTIVTARQLYSYFARKYTAKTLVQIAEKINRDHSSVHHSIIVIETLLAYDKDIKLFVKKIGEEIEKYQ